MFPLEGLRLKHLRRNEGTVVQGAKPKLPPALLRKRIRVVKNVSAGPGSNPAPDTESPEENYLSHLKLKSPHL